MDTPDNTPKAVTIPLTRGQIALVDECDSDLLEFNWYADFHPKYRDGGAYLAKRNVTISTGKYSTVSMHRTIYARIVNRPLLRSEQVDHKNLNPLDNRRENLRLANHSQNQGNTSKPKTSTSGFKGVHLNKKTRKWNAEITCRNKKYRLGSFDTPEAAHEAYKITALKLFGEFARFD